MAGSSFENRSISIFDVEDGLSDNTVISESHCCEEPLNLKYAG
jgi:hypothetical protein